MVLSTQCKKTSNNNTGMAFCPHDLRGQGNRQSVTIVLLMCSLSTINDSVFPYLFRNEIHLINITQVPSSVRLNSAQIITRAVDSCSLYNCAYALLKKCQTDAGYLLSGWTFGND